MPGDVFLSGRPRGPLVTPGQYQVKLTVDGKSQTVPIEVKLDPRVQISSADLGKQLEFALQIRDLLGRASGAILETRELRTQLEALQIRLAAIRKRKTCSRLPRNCRKKRPSWKMH